MKKHYEKLLLVLALLVLAGGIVLSLGGGESSSAQVKTSVSDTDLRGEPFEPITPPVIRADKRIWDAPVPQDGEGLERFGVFTPPQIFLNPKDNALVFVPPVPPPPPEPFGLELISMGHPVYPVSFEAYFEPSDGNMRDATVMLYHKDLDESSGIVKVGSTIDKWNIRVQRLDVDKVEADGIIDTVVSITLKDNNLNRVFTLQPGETIYLDDQNILILQATHPVRGEEFRWSKVGDTHEYEGAKYTLEEINFDKMSLTVKKESDSLEEPQSETLKPTSSGKDTSEPDAISTEKPETETPPTEDASFDAIFN